MHLSVSESEGKMDLQYTSVLLKESSSSCLLCAKKNCSRACSHGVDPAKILYSLRFENTVGAYAEAIKNSACINCTSRECEQVCLKKKISSAAASRPSLSDI